MIKTLINAGESFEYDLHFPLDEPPGLYWYHSHIHGIQKWPYRVAHLAPSAWRVFRMWCLKSLACPSAC